MIIVLNECSTMKRLQFTIPQTRARATARALCPVYQLFHTNRDMTENNNAKLSDCKWPILEPTRMRCAILLNSDRTEKKGNNEFCLIGTNNSFSTL